MPLKRRVFHHAVFPEFIVLRDCRVCSRLIASLFEVACRFEAGRMRGLHEVLEKSCEVMFCTLRQRDSIRSGRVSTGDEVAVTVSSWSVLEVYKELSGTRVEARGRRVL